MVRIALVAALSVFGGAAVAQTLPPPRQRQLARDILAELVAINTTHDSGSGRAAAALAASLHRQAGIPVYDNSGIFYDVDDVRTHGRDERVGVREFYEGVEFMFRLRKELAS
jgi:acetylornithine deacetylase/succinyl-diaminopimelate desuccinylase-like protein